jgi:hypothetical protein
MVYAQRSRHGIWKYRRSIPQALRLVAGSREINVSFKTRDEQVAQLAYVKAHGEAEKYLRDLGRLSACPRTVSGDKEIDELGRAFLRQIKMPYVPLVLNRARPTMQMHSMSAQSAVRRLSRSQSDCAVANVPTCS